MGSGTKSLLTDGGCTIAFEPVVDIVAGRIYAYEAILRGRRGELASQIFAMIDSKSRGEFERRYVSATIRWAMAAGLGDTTARLSIPIYALDAAEPGEPVSTALETGRQCGLIPERMTFAVHGYQDMPGGLLADIVHRAGKVGARVTFVGLGPDQGGLGTCARYAPNAIKLDDELVNGITSSWSRRLILEELTPRIRKIGARIFTGGVDSDAMLARLRGFGIYHVQGDHVGAAEIGMLPDSPLVTRGAEDARLRNAWSGVADPEMDALIEGLPGRIASNDQQRPRLAS